MTRLADLRNQYAVIKSDFLTELKDNGQPFNPNLFLELVDGGVKIWDESGDSIIIPDAAVKPIKTRFTWLVGTATT